MARTRTIVTQPPVSARAANQGLIRRLLMAAAVAAVISGCDPDSELGRGAAGDEEGGAAAEQAEQPLDTQVTRDTQVVQLPQVGPERP